MMWQLSMLPSRLKRKRATRTKFSCTPSSSKPSRLRSSIRPGRSSSQLSRMLFPLFSMASGMPQMVQSPAQLFHSSTFFARTRFMSPQPRKGAYIGPRGSQKPMPHLVCTSYPHYTFRIEAAALRRLARCPGDDDTFAIRVAVKKRRDPRLLIDLVVGETLLLAPGMLLCTLLSVDFAYSGRTAVLTARLLTIEP
jgi:hypothetical protein